MDRSYGNYCVISDDAEIGDGTRIGNFVLISRQDENWQGLYDRVVCRHRRGRSHWRFRLTPKWLSHNSWRYY